MFPDTVAYRLEFGDVPSSDSVLEVGYSGPHLPLNSSFNHSRSLKLCRICRVPFILAFHKYSLFVWLLIQVAGSGKARNTEDLSPNKLYGKFIPLAKVFYNKLTLISRWQFSITI